MNETLNLKEISKRIKSSGKSGSIIWCRQEKQHFISNRHFLLRIEEIPSEILISLFSIFLKVPAVGETLTSFLGKIQENTKPIDFESIYKPQDQPLVGQVTPYLKVQDKKFQMRVIQFPNHFSFVDEKYMLMTLDKESRTTDPNMSLYFSDNNLMLLPFRMGDKIDERLSDLLGASNN